MVVVYLLLLFYFMCMGTSNEYNAYGGQKMLDPPGTGVLGAAVMSVLILGTEPRSSGRAASSLNGFKNRSYSVAQASLELI